MHEKKFTLYENLLREWNNKMNLIAPSTLPRIRERHIMDSAALANYIPNDKIVLDLGSGAGFPAVVLAIMGFEVIAIESIAKKCRFLETVKSALDLSNLIIINDRVENITKCGSKSLSPTKLQPIGHDIKKYVFTARAFAPLIKILDWTETSGIPYILLKGENVKSEIEEASKKYKFDYTLTPSSAGPGYILYIQKINNALTN